MKSKYKRELILFNLFTATLFGGTFGFCAVKFPSELFLTSVILFILLVVVTLIGINVIGRRSRNDPE